MKSLERVFATVGGQPKDRPAFVLNLSLHLPFRAVAWLQVVPTLIKGAKCQWLGSLPVLNPHPVSSSHQGRVQTHLVTPAAEAAAALEPGKVPMHVHEGILQGIL